MKKINFPLCNAILFVIMFLVAQSIFAVDVPLKSDTANATSNPRNLSRSAIANPAKVNQEGSELIINFSQAVGFAQISITDPSGAAVYQDVLDTNFDSSLVIPTNDLNSGVYTIRITYSSKSIIGEFSL